MSTKEIIHEIIKKIVCGSLMKKPPPGIGPHQYIIDVLSAIHEEMLRCLPHVHDQLTDISHDCAGMLCMNKKLIIDMI